MSSITRDDIIKLARLSKLALTDEEIDIYSKELAAILSFVEKLDEVDVTGLKPTYQVSGAASVYRTDVVQEQAASPDALLGVAPKTKDRLLQVKRMI